MKGIRIQSNLVSMSSKRYLKKAMTEEFLKSSHFAP